MTRKIFAIALVTFAMFSYAQESNQIVVFLRDFLENSKFENYQILEKHCDAKLLKKLAADYDYECNEAPCYAVWDFRGGASDVLKWKILDIKAEADDWFTYTFQENDVVGKRQVKARLVNGTVILFDMKK